jgi:hypothetical protein
MAFKLRQRYLLLFILAIVGWWMSLGLVPHGFKINQVIATAPPEQHLLETIQTKSVADLEAEGKYFYDIAQFQQAADL